MPRVGPDGQISKAARKASATVAAKPKKPETLSEAERKAQHADRAHDADLTNTCVDDLFERIIKLSVDLEMPHDLERVAARVGHLLAVKVRKRPKVNTWTQHVKEYMAVVNAGKDKGTRARIMDLTEEGMEAMTDAYDKLSEDEIKALAERGQKDRDAKDALVASGSTTGCRLGSRAAKGIATHSWENILALIDTLCFMRGGEVFLLFARSSGSSMFDSRSFSTPKAKAFFHHLTGAIPDEIVLGLESFVVSGICKLFRMADKSGPKNMNASEHLKRQKEIGEKITAGWVKLMHEHGKGYLNMRQVPEREIGWDTRESAPVGRSPLLVVN